MSRRVFKTVLLIGLFALSGALQIVAAADQPYTVDGLPLGGKVHPESAIYREYKCQDSTQFQDFKFCSRKKTEIGPKGPINILMTILHDRDNVAAYINKQIEPAFFSGDDVKTEIDRLSKKYGQPQILDNEVKNGTLKGKIGIWGVLQLRALNASDLDLIRSDRSPGKGILVDFFGDFSKSARLGMPVFGIDGNRGMIWNASYDETGRGALRFFAIDAARLKAAHQGVRQEAANQRQDGKMQTDDIAKKELREKTIAELRAAERRSTELIESCEPACPDNPEAIDKIDALMTALDSEKLVADEASLFAASIGNEARIEAYVSSCKKCEFLSDAKTQLIKLQTAKANAVRSVEEEAQYRAAVGNADSLRKYIADCNVCAFATEALRTISDDASQFEKEMFKLDVCNNEFLPVTLAIVARQDVNSSDLWASEGWWTIDSGECKPIGTYVKGSIYYFAKNKRAVWKGEHNFCTLNSAFIRIATGEECSDEESLTGFREQSGISDSQYTLTLNAKPWSYTALALSGLSGAWGWAPEYSSREAADKTALELCRQHALDCSVAQTVRDDMCLALAIDGNGGWGWASNQDRSEARRDARNRCNDTGSACYVEKQSCSSAE